MGEDAVCRLPAHARAQRTADFRALFAGAVVERHRAAEEVRWTLPGGAERETESRRLAALEARCCDGIEFGVQRDGDLVTWRISGPPSAASLLATFYELPVLVSTDAGADDLWTRLDSAACAPALE